MSAGRSWGPGPDFYYTPSCLPGSTHEADPTTAHDSSYVNGFGVRGSILTTVKCRHCGRRGYTHKEMKTIATDVVNWEQQGLLPD